MITVRDGPLQNLLGGGGRSTKKYSRKGKLNKRKILVRQSILKNIHAMSLKKIKQGI